jgi:alkanesulfonate monooxygenase SsuD/methylene tetrahydromethanopterin reductase-like flavin-dependent oxidoreductase (luciferase family)
MMDVGVALPQMARGLDRSTLMAWCRGIDEGPFSSISAGERITFHNLDGFTLCSAAAALTERVRVFVNVVVLPWHSTALVAKELASIDVVSDGRCDVAVGVGGRRDDYDALGASFERRHQRVDEGVTEMRRLWSGGLAGDGQPVGPPPVQPAGPRVYASAMGPKAMARAAQWADGVSGFSLLGESAEMERSASAARDAWTNANRETAPRLITGSFAALGPDAPTKLHDFAASYLGVFGAELASGLAAAMRLHDPVALHDVLHTAAGLGYDEFIIVPGDSDPACLNRLAEVVTNL